MPIEGDNNQLTSNDRPLPILNSSEFYNEFNNLLISDGNQESIDTLANLLLPITKLDATSCKGPVLPVNDIRGIDSRSYAKNERYLRCKLASLHRVIDLYGWNYGTCYNHVSVRVNNNTDQFLIKPIGLAFHEVTGSSLVKIDGNGSIVDPGSTTFGVNSLSFSLYSFVYKSRSDFNCIIHVQTPAVTAVSAMKFGLLALSQEAAICGQATIHEIQIDSQTNQLSLNNKLDESKSKILILPNHGILACGTTIEDAWHKTFHLILACEAQLRAVSLGIDNLILTSDRANEQVTETVSTGGGGVNSTDIKWSVGELEWSTLMTVLDKAGYHTGYIYREPLIRLLAK